MIGCAKRENEVLIVKNSVRADQIVKCTSTNQIKVCLQVMYKGDLPEIKVVQLYGEGVDDVKSFGSVISEDFEEDFSYKDYSLCSYMLTLDLEDRNKGETVEIEGVSLSINDNIVDTTFEKTLEYKFIGEEESNKEDLKGDCVPNIAGGIDTVLNYTYTANANLSIESLDTNELIDINHTKIYINDEYAGNISSLPINISKGDKVEFEIIPALVDGEFNWTNIYTNMIINYSKNSRKYSNISELLVISVTNQEDVKKIIDYMIN